MTLDAMVVAAPLVLDHLYADLPNEAVGLIWSDGTVRRLTNQARSPSRFSVGEVQLAEAFAEVNPDEKILAAYYHTHPGGDRVLSGADQACLRIQYAAGLDIPWMVMVPSGDWQLWEWDYGRAMPLQGGRVMMVASAD